MAKPPDSRALSKFKEGLAHHQQGRLREAQVLYQSAHQLDPMFADAVHHMGIIALQTNRISDAINMIQQAIQLDPTDPGAYNNLGMALEDGHKHEEALVAYDNALRIAPQHIEALLNRGNVLQTLKRWDLALNSYEKLIALAPNFADAYNNRGNVLRALKRHQEAIASFDRALSFNPGYAQALNNKGIALKDLNRLSDALQCYDQAIRLQPNYAEAFSNRGVVLKDLGHMEPARISFDRAIALNPNYAQAYGNRGGLLQELGKNKEALQDYEKALTLDSGIMPLYGKRMHVQMLLCDWTDFQQRRDQIVSGLNQNILLVDPFTVLTTIDSLALQKKVAELTVNEQYPEINTLGPIQNRPSGSKIRLGYFSADLRNHPVAYLMAELFEKHDKNKFELFAFSLGRPVRDDMQKRIAAAFDHFIEVDTQSDEEIAKLARSCNIDIAIDLGGYTIHNRTGIFSYRAAPVQVQYIGYLGTMGAPYIDYLLADPVLIPDNSRSYYTECIAYLPSYQANDSKRKVSTKEFSRFELGLPESAFVFCCFNNNYKITPETFDSWMRILGKAPNSVLFLYANDQDTRANLKREAERRGIEPSRIVFGQRLERDEYLARYRAADLFLDTLPYNAGTTASDALWAGLPVLTCAGESFAARMCASVLQSIGLSELITTTIEEYELTAIELATNHNAIVELKQKLDRQKHSTALFDSDSFCRNLESAYQSMHVRCQSQMRPQTFEVSVTPCD